jgi:hypothetical protein
MASLKKQRTVARRKRTKAEEKERSKKFKKRMLETKAAGNKFRRKIKEQLGFDKMKLVRKSYTKDIKDVNSNKYGNLEDNLENFTNQFSRLVFGV